MNKLTTIGKKEQLDISRRTAMIRAAYTPETTEECAELYRNAEEIATVAAIALKDGLQGKALLQAKKNLCGKEWNAVSLTHAKSLKWKEFLNILNLIDKQGKVKVNVRFLLDFAGYKEEGGEIETASHMREVKKIAGPKVEDIDKAYADAGGSENKSARELKENLTKTKIYVKDIFVREVGAMPETAMTIIQVGAKVLEKLPYMSEDEWKTWYRTASRCMHPDHGGTVHDFSILNSLNEMITVITENTKKQDTYNEWNNDYKQWKEDHGYKTDFTEE